MREGKFTIGVDFGTLSARAVLVDVTSGYEVCAAESPYKHGVMTEVLPDGRTPLAPGSALQHPQDYLDALAEVVGRVVGDSGVEPERIIGLGISFTSCTILPTFAEGTPLCLDDAFQHDPAAWVQLWKHRVAQAEADQMTAVAADRNESFLYRCGGRISSEWMFPKVWRVLRESPRVYAAAHRFVEAGDWIVGRLTGTDVGGASAAGYKAFWDPDEGFPSPDFFAAVDSRLRDVAREKVGRQFLPPAAAVGTVTDRAARELGLSPRTVVATANIDAHASVPAATVVEPGKMVMVMGTSISHLVLAEELRPIQGICGVVRDGIVPGYYGYEAGQPAVGDMFRWFVDNCVPGRYEAEARRRGVSVHQVLSERAAQLVPGQSGLLTLDWWNGNRSMLDNARLSGLVLGLHLNTKPEEMYRSLLEGAAFGTAVIVEAFEDAGIRVNELYACGGLPKRNALLMQVFADVLGRPIKVAASSQTSALGAAIFAAVAAGEARGGWRDMGQAVAHMARIDSRVYEPDPQRHGRYQQLLDEYKALTDYFGRGANGVMERLYGMRSGAHRQQVQQAPEDSLQSVSS